MVLTTLFFSVSLTSKQLWGPTLHLHKSPNVLSEDPDTQIRIHASALADLPWKLHHGLITESEVKVQFEQHMRHIERNLVHIHDPGLTWTRACSHCDKVEQPNEKPFQHCPGCNMYFCSDDCYKKAWPEHKAICCKQSWQEFAEKNNVPKGGRKDAKRRHEIGAVIGDKNYLFIFNKAIGIAEGVAALEDWTGESISKELKASIDHAERQMKGQREGVWDEDAFICGWLWAWEIRFCRWDGTNLLVEFTEKPWKKYGYGIFVDVGGGKNTVSVQVMHKGKPKIFDVPTAHIKNLDKYQYHTE